MSILRYIWFYNMYVYAFEKLEVWKLAKDFALSLYQLTRSFPEDEKFIMVGQIRRSGRSIPANIAEGSTRFSKKDQDHFYSIAYGSAIEILNDLIIATELKYINVEQLTAYRSTIEQLTFKINALRNSTQRN